MFSIWVPVKQMLRVHAGCPFFLPTAHNITAQFDHLEHMFEVEIQTDLDLYPNVECESFLLDTPSPGDVEPYQIRAPKIDLLA